jgi:Flp pilus assembly protein TadD
MAKVLLVILVFSLGANAQTAIQAGLADGLFDNAQYADAAAAFAALPELEKTARVWNRLGMSYHMNNQPREAEAAYKRAIRVDETYAPSYNNLAALYYFQQDYGDADEEFRNAAERDAASEVIRRNLRAARYARENNRPARARAAELVSQRPLLLMERSNDYLTIATLLPQQAFDDALNFERRADAFLARKMYEDAVIEYRKSIALDRYNASVVVKLGIAYHQSQKVKEADEQYREALKLNPHYVQALNNRGTVEYSKRNFSGALDQYRKALRLQPESPTVLLNIGACLFEMGPSRYEEAALAYQTALSIDPGLFERVAVAGAGTLIQMQQRSNPMMNFYLARIFAERGQADLAISYLYRAIESGFRDVQMLRDEQAFTVLAADERFARLLESMVAPEPNSEN